MRLRCWLLGHDRRQVQCVDHLPESGSLVVVSECSRCGDQLIGEVDAQGFVGTNRPEGPWDAEPCAICEKPTLMSETHDLRTWPDLVICRECKKLWDEV